MPAGSREGWSRGKRIGYGLKTWKFVVKRMLAVSGETTIRPSHPLAGLCGIRAQDWRVVAVGIVM